MNNTNCSRRGAAIIYTVFLMLALLAIISLAVDWGRVQVVQSELQSTVDAASLAASSGLPYSSAEVRRRAKEIASSNAVGGAALVLQDSDIELGIWDRDTGSFTKLNGVNESTATAVRITGQMTVARGNPVRLTFAPLIGFHRKELRATGIAGFAQAADVVLVQDITTSFAAELDDAKIGDQALLDALYAGGTGRSSFGIVVHTGWGQTLRGLNRIDTDYANLSQVISSIRLAGSSGMPNASGTDISEGLREAIEVFDNYDYSTRPNAVRAIVLVSDGSPTQSSNGANPTLNADALLALAQQRASEAWSRGIHVYIVYFNRDGDQTAASKVATLKRGTGDFVQVSDPNDLPVALERLTRRLPMALLK